MKLRNESVGFHGFFIYSRVVMYSCMLHVWTIHQHVPLEYEDSASYSISMYLIYIYVKTLHGIYIYVYTDIKYTLTAITYK